HRAVHLQDLVWRLVAEREEDHADRRALEGALEALLALASAAVGGLGLGADGLVESPGDDARDARRGDEATVDRRPLPRMRHRVRMVVDPRGMQCARDAVV